MKRMLKDRRGFALILTILVISLIVSFTLHFNESMRSDLVAADGFKKEFSLYSTAMSGFAFCLAVLHEDGLQSDYDSDSELWALPAEISSYWGGLSSGDEVRLAISDHSGRININMLVDENGQYRERQKELLTRFFSLEEFELDPEEIGNIIDAVKDWIDEDDEVTRFGEERGYYLSLDPPYECRNGTFESLEELLLVRGIDQELFYGDGRRPGISRHLTIYGDGKININTAGSMVLMALDEQIDSELAEEMISYRRGDEDLNSAAWYQQVPGMSGITLDGELITTESSIFQIDSIAEDGTGTRRIRGVVERKESEVIVLSWRLDQQ